MLANFLIHLEDTREIRVKENGLIEICPTDSEFSFSFTRQTLLDLIESGLREGFIRQEDIDARFAHDNDF